MSELILSIPTQPKFTTYFCDFPFFCFKTPLDPKLENLTPLREFLVRHPGNRTDPGCAILNEKPAKPAAAGRDPISWNLGLNLANWG